MKKLIIIICLLLTNCSPQNIQNWFVTTAPDGSLRHHFTGYTNLGETHPDSSRKYLEKAMLEQCKSPYHIIRLDEWPTYNAAGKFLGWTGEGQCDKQITSDKL